MLSSLFSGISNIFRDNGIEVFRFNFSRTINDLFWFDFCLRYRRQHLESSFRVGLNFHHIWWIHSPWWHLEWCLFPELGIHWIHDHFGGPPLFGKIWFILLLFLGCWSTAWQTAYFYLFPVMTVSLVHSADIAQKRGKDIDQHPSIAPVVCSRSFPHIVGWEMKFCRYIILSIQKHHYHCDYW